MSYCLPKTEANAFIAALKTRAIDPEKMMDMSSADRRAVFAKVIGAANAEGVNAAFESKLLLKDQQAGLQRWITDMAGLQPKTRKDFLDKVKRMENVLEPTEEKAFLADLAAKKFGHSVTFDEAKTISTGAKNIATLQEKWNPTTQSWASATDQYAYGVARQAYKKYVGELMRDANAKTFKEWLTQPKGRAVLDAANSIKGIVASLDDSFFGRQGFKTLARSPDIWARAFAKSFVDMKNVLWDGSDPIDAIMADILSRPNMMNGKYTNAKLALGQDFEEAFPTALPEKIPVLGRLYKASEAAFVGGALRLRADLADRFIPKAEAAGVDLSVPGEQAKAIGQFINSMTGRGDISALVGDNPSEWINAAFFSLRFVKSSWDTLTAHTWGLGIEPGPARSFVRKQAALNLLHVVGTMALIYAIAGMLDPDSVELDPRSSNFGKIKIGNTRFDISGGMASLVVLAARQISGTTKNSKGKIVSLSSTKFGARNRLDVLEDFMEGKASPALGLLFNNMRGTDIAGNKLTFTGQVANAITPIGLATGYEALQDPKAAPLLAIMIADGIGFGASTYGPRRSHAKASPEIWDSAFWEDNTQPPTEATP